ALNALTFLASALGLRTLRQPEPEPPTRAADHHWRRDLPTGWRFLLAHPTLGPLFWNAMLFGAMIMASSPLMLVLMLRDLGLEPWQYGLALGLPCVGGIAGAALAPWLERRAQRPERVLVVLGAVRTVWLLPMAFAPPGTTGLLVLIACDTAMLLCAGAFNPLFVAHRMAQIPDHLMARASSAWSITNRVVQPIAMLLAGLLAAATSTRWAIAIVGVGLIASCALLPWRRLWSGADHPPPTAAGAGATLRQERPSPE
ncbi:MAG: MFS transporter, partial [Brachybacterium sp.]|nr:MFS transporter [Brachybacterium sp.]